MANPEHLARLKDGIDAWNDWRNDSPEIRPDLSGADLAGADLNRADLFRVDLSQTNLRETDLSDADLSSASLCQANLNWANLIGANLSKANGSGADLRGANLRRANLIDADLTQADLTLVNLYAADLSGADLARALLFDTTFADTDLSRVRGLNEVHHVGPSAISLDTIYKSKGKIPHSFLRGCGVPENFIEYMASLAGSGIEFYSLFISYSTPDEEFAKRLHADLQANGVRCWFAPHNMQGGRKIFTQIDEAIRVYDRLLIVLSPVSMDSEWVRTEIALARRKERAQGIEVLFPITLCPHSQIKEWQYFDADIGKDSAREIREYHIPNFSNWKDHDAYKASLERLLVDLKGKPRH